MRWVRKLVALTLLGGCSGEVVESSLDQRTDAGRDASTVLACDCGCVGPHCCSCADAGSGAE